MAKLELDDDEARLIVQILRQTPLPWEISNPLLTKVAAQLQRQGVSPHGIAPFVLPVKEANKR